MNKRQLKSVVEFLNERYDIMRLTNSPSDKAYYDGAVMAILKCNLTVLRNEDGYHKIF